MEQEVFDITIIGAGPAGLFGAFYSGLREMKTKIIEFHPFLGGKLNLYPEKIIWDMGGLPPTPAGKVIDHLVDQAKVFEPTIELGQQVTNIDKTEENIFVLTTDTGQKHYSKTILVATGYGVLIPIKLDLEGAEKYELTNLKYTVQKPQSMRGKKVLISGGGNSAVDWANLLEPIAEQVYIVYRKDELKGHEAEVKKLLSTSVKCYFNVTIDRLIADQGENTISKVRLKNVKDDSIEEIDVDEVVINHGYESEKTIFDNNSIGLEQFDTYYVSTSVMGETAVPGVFAAGDVVMHEGKLHLIAGAFQDAVNAVNKAKQFVAPDAYGHGRVSSHNDKFDQKNKALIQEFFVEGNV